MGFLGHRNLSLFHIRSVPGLLWFMVFWLPPSFVDLSLRAARPSSHNFVSTENGGRAVAGFYAPLPPPSLTSLLSMAPRVKEVDSSLASFAGFRVARYSCRLLSC